MGIISQRWYNGSGRNSQMNTNERKIDRQLAGQSSSTPFMSIKESYNNKTVTFDTQDGLEDKID